MVCARAGGLERGRGFGRLVEAMKPRFWLEVKKKKMMKGLKERIRRGGGVEWKYRLRVLRGFG
jgi:hypothetical protein